MPGDTSLQTGASVSQVSPPHGRFQCSECQKTFGRVEHLSRHSQSHSRERSHKCPRCRKGFYRLDALMRHEKIHQNPEAQPAGKVSRACLACSAARRKCSRGLPCSACVQRQIECIFPSSAKSPGRLEAGDWAPDRRVGSITSPTSWDNNTTQSGEIQPSYSYSNLSPENGDADFSSMEQVSDQMLDNNPDSTITVSNAGNGTETNLSGHQPIWNTGASLPTYQENWLENNFSSINWLPDDWTPAFADAMNLSSLAQPIQLGESPTQAQAHQNDFDEPSGVITAESRRHWLQTNTPRESLASEQASSTPQSQPSTGRLYVDGDGARLPRVRKTPYQYDETFTQESEEDYQSNSNTQDLFWFPDLENPDWSSDASVHQAAQISPELYDQIFEAFQSTCITSNHFRIFYTPNFPSIGFINRYLQLYLFHFQPIFPFIHTASFSAHSAHWLLILALSAIGSLYFKGNHKDDTQCSVAMLEFLRRALLTFEEVEQTSRLDELLLSQVKLLSCVGFMYCGNHRLLEKAKSSHGNLVRFCRAEWSSVDPVSRASVDQPGPEAQWKTWHESESRRRTGYCIWLLDCMWMVHFQTRPLLTLEDANVAVPCQEVLWEAESALDWQQLYSVSTESLSLHSAMQRAYIEKQVQSSMGEFTRILCIHAIFQRTWDVESYFKKPLSVWNPTAERQDIQTITKLLPIWPPGVPTYSKWRNSACDVLDIYHWHANSVIGAASGMEHPTVLHLHLARVVLLTPFREIVELTHILTGETTSATKTDDISKLKKHIQRWALEDQFKARLAMIHAGVLFWHVRRYSTDAFYEPSSVFLATLALWAYGTFARRTPAEDSDDEGHFPTSMQLDRPADDELVQLFVKRGAVMKAKITGVGNLCSEKGPGRILIEGSKLLKGLRRWGIGKELIGTLGCLAAKGLEKDEQVVS